MNDYEITNNLLKNQKIVTPLPEDDDDDDDDDEVFKNSYISDINRS